MSKQESISDYYEMAKEIAKVEKQLNIEHWDVITISRTGDKEGDYVRLFQYDLPRHIADKYDWVIRWRTARFQCQYPRYYVLCSHSPYRKVMGNNIGMQEDLNTFIAAKALVTKQKNRLEKYIAKQKESLFYDETTDELTMQGKAKLERNIQNVAQAEARLIEKVKQFKAQHQKSITKS